MAGANGIKRQAIIPTIRDQKQIRGSTNRLVNGATSEILLKWKRSKGKVPSIAAVVTAIPARIHLRSIFGNSCLISVAESFETGLCLEAPDKV